MAAAADRGARRLHQHNPSVTLLRTSADESRRVGEALAAPLAAAARPELVRVLLPGRGLSLLSTGPDAPFADPAADAALYEAKAAGRDTTRTQSVAITPDAVHQVHDPVAHRR